MRDLTGSAESVVLGGSSSAGSARKRSGKPPEPSSRCAKRQRRPRRGGAPKADEQHQQHQRRQSGSSSSSSSGSGSGSGSGSEDVTMMIEQPQEAPAFVGCLRRIVSSEDPDEVAEAWNSLEEMENLESGSQNSTYDCNRNYDKFLRSILTESRIRNIGEIPRLLEWFSKFPFPNAASNPISNDIAYFLLSSAEDFKEQPCLAEIIQVLNINHEKYLPPHTDHSNLWKALVEALSWIKVPKDSGEIKKYNKDLDVISEFLKKKYFESSKYDSSFMCFNKLREILLKSNRTEDPSSALIIVLQLVDEELWRNYMNIAVEQIINENTDLCRVEKMLSLFCYWLVQPPFNHMKYLSTWLTLFMRCLIERNKRRTPMDVADVVLPAIFSNCLRLPQFYQIEFEDNIIFFLMQHVSSLELHHKMMKFIDNYLVDEDRMSSNQNEPKVRQYIIKTAINLLMKFKGHLENHCQICEKVKKLVYENSKRKGAYVAEEKEEMEISYPSTSSGIGRIDTGKVGLKNLGNTCYMNSVLQALVMTRQFCHEVLLYKTTNDLSDQTVLKHLQNLFALLKYSDKISLAPTDILRASRPAYFMPGQQQDSSEFLCHLLDVMYEQEKSALIKSSNSDQNISMNSKVEDKEMVDIEEAAGTSDSPVNDDGTPKAIARWTTEENLSEGVSLQRKTQSLADFTQGEELAQTQNGLSDSHSDSTDSGIQSVGGEDSSSSTSAAASPGFSSYLVHRVFGGELKVTYRCLQCDTESHNTDRFRDLQLCFVETLSPSHEITVQDLINCNYTAPENLTGDNKYRCDRCASLCDAYRINSVLQAPAHLILTLKHFRYDSESRLRTKLQRKVSYDETIQLPVLNQENETYQLYAAVVHSGYSMDYGHYITYACDAKNRWYKFNDSYVSQTTLEDFKRLEPPDTPYILFYRRCGRQEEPDEDAPEFPTLGKSLQDYVEKMKRDQSDEGRVTRLSAAGSSGYRYNSNFWNKDNDDDEDNPPPSKCGEALNIPNQQFLC